MFIVADWFVVADALVTRSETVIELQFCATGSVIVSVVLALVPPAVTLKMLVFTTKPSTVVYEIPIVIAVAANVFAVTSEMTCSFSELYP